MVVRASSASLAYLNAHSIVPIYLFLNKTRTYVVYIFSILWTKNGGQLSGSSFQFRWKVRSFSYPLPFMVYLSIKYFGRVAFRITQLKSLLAFHLVAGEESILKEEKPKLLRLALHNEQFSIQILRYYKLNYSYNNHLCQPAQMAQSNISKGDSDCEYRVLVSNLLYSN